MKQSFLTTVLVTFSLVTSAHAMTVEGYQKIKAGKLDTAVPNRELLLTMYFQGISESVITLMDAGGALHLGDVGKACIPSWRAVTADIMENSLIDVIEKAKKQGSASKIAQGSAAAAAIYGLPSIFPCK